MTKLVCTECGAEAKAACNCGAPYEPKIEKARKAIAENPQGSNRAIAADIDADEKVVRRARGADVSAPEPERRTGRDGKQYPAKKPYVSPLTNRPCGLTTFVRHTNKDLERIRADKIPKDEAQQPPPELTPDPAEAKPWDDSTREAWVKRIRALADDVNSTVLEWRTIESASLACLRRT